MLIKLTCFIFTILVVFATGCNQKPVADSTDMPVATVVQSETANVNSMTPPYFVQQKEAPNVYMQADLTGKLVLVNGCLRMQSDTSDYLIVWPWDFSLREDGEIIEILDGKMQTVARVGENLTIGGGGGSGAEGLLSQPLPEECTGPYWIVGNEIIRHE